MTAPDPADVRCRCCDGTGTVPDIDDNPRPCSRCRAREFGAWAAARSGRERPQPRLVTQEES